MYKYFYAISSINFHRRNRARGGIPFIEYEMCGVASVDGDTAVASQWTDTYTVLQPQYMIFTIFRLGEAFDSRKRSTFGQLSHNEHTRGDMCVCVCMHKNI